MSSQRTITLRALPALALLAALVLAAGLVAASAAAQDGSLRANIANVETAEYPTARATLNVEDQSGNSLEGLTKDSFTILIDGQETEVTAAELVSSTTSPLDVLLMIDTSGSTQGPTLAAAKAAAIAFIQALAPEDRVAIMRFANSVTVQQDFTTDKSAAIAAVNGLVSDGQTELYKAAAGAINQAATSTSSRRAIVFLTDGAQDAIVTSVTASQALAVGSSTGIPVYTIAVGDAILDSSFVQDLARVTGGSYLEAPTASDLGGVYESVGRLLQNQYVVTFDAASVAGKPQANISVTVRTGARSASSDAVLVPGADFLAPSVTVAGLTPGETLDGPREITVTAGAETLESVAFYVDGVNVFEVDNPPFAYTFDPDRFGEGEHAFRVTATIDGNPIRTEPVTFSSVPAETVPVPSNDASGGGGGLPILPIAGVAGLALLAFIGFLVVNRIKQTSAPVLKIASPDQRVTPWAARHRTLTPQAVETAPDPIAPVKEDIGEALGLLISRSGSDLGVEYQVGGKPVSIGSGANCAVRINDPSLASEEARIWIRKDHLMYHRLSRLTTIATEGVTGGWQMLEPGESFKIGEHTFEFRLLPSHVPGSDATPTDVPNILRGAGDEPRPERSAPEPAPPPFVPQPGLADARPRLTEMMPREMGFSHQDVDDDPEAAAS